MKKTEKVQNIIKKDPFKIIFQKYNLIEYFRLLLLIIGSVLYYISPLILITFFTINIILDYVLVVIAKEHFLKFTYSMIFDCMIDCLGNTIMAYFICNKDEGYLGFFIFALSNIHVIQEWYQNIICFQKDIFFKDFISRFELVNWYYRNPVVLDLVYAFENIFLVLSMLNVEYGFSLNFFWVYYTVGGVYFLCSVIRCLATVDCFLKMAEHDAKEKNKLKED